MKRFFSLLEVSIGLALTAILVTTLFSSFRHLMKKGAMMENTRAQLHGEHLLNLRLNQIFEAVSGKIFLGPHDDAKGDAFFFTFDNGTDPEPEYCGKIRGVLFATKDKKSSICIRLNDKREERFIENITNFSVELFHPDEQQWQDFWKKSHKTPMVRIKIDDKAFSYILPRIDQRVNYSK